MKFLKVKIVFCILLVFMPAFCFAEELRILCWEGYASPEYTQKFEKMIKANSGIDLKIKVTNASDPNEFFEALRAEKADLISPAHNIPKSPKWGLIEKKQVLSIDLSNVPNYKDIIPALQKADYITQDGQVYGVPIVYGPYGVFYNTNIIKQEPKSAAIFWDPQYAGKYAISEDYHEANIYLTALSMGHKRENIFKYDDMDKPEIKDKLGALARNAKSFWVGADSADVLQGLAFATGWGFALSELKKRGEVWKMANLDEGTTGYVDNWMISASLKDNPKLKKIAEEWINFSISPEIQVGYVKNISQFPVNATIKDKLTPEEIEYFHVGDSEYFKKKFILWEVLDIRSQNGFKNMWKEAKESKKP